MLKFLTNIIHLVKPQNRSDPLWCACLGAGRCWTTKHRRRRPRGRRRPPCQGRASDLRRRTPWKYSSPLSETTATRAGEAAPPRHSSCAPYPGHEKNSGVGTDGPGARAGRENGGLVSSVAGRRTAGLRDGMPSAASSSPLITSPPLSNSARRRRPPVAGHRRDQAAWRSPQRLSPAMPGEARKEKAAHQKQRRGSVEFGERGRRRGDPGFLLGTAAIVQRRRGAEHSSGGLIQDVDSIFIGRSILSGR